jgi:hypothetical protein
MGIMVSLYQEQNQATRISIKVMQIRNPMLGIRLRIRTYLFWPPKSRSVSTRYGSGSGSFHHQATTVRKTFLHKVLRLLCDFYL